MSSQNKGDISIFIFYCKADHNAIVIAIAEDGCSMKQIALRCNINKNLVFNILKKLITRSLLYCTISVYNFY